MYYILTYDIASPKRLQKTLKICRRYLLWISRSVYEGHLSPAQCNRLLGELKAVINKKEDSVILFTLRNEAVFEKDVLGKQPEIDGNFLG